MRKFKTDAGKPAGKRPNVLVVSPDLVWTANKILNSATDITTTGELGVNTIFKALKIVVNDYLTDTNNWYLFDTRGVVKPIILQMRKAPTFSQLTDGTEAEFMRKKLYFGVDWRGAVAFGDWRNGYASIVS
jgi:phage major head subunit gpT-like protein